MNLVPVIVLLALSLTIRPASSNILWYTYPWHVYVVNEMSHGMNLMVHCQSIDDDLGVRNLKPMAEFEWKFKLNIFGDTVFWCYWRPEKGNIYANFDVFWYNEKFYYKCGYMKCVWIAKDDGLYLRNIPEQVDEHWYGWVSGTDDGYKLE